MLSFFFHAWFVYARREDEDALTQPALEFAVWDLNNTENYIKKPRKHVSLGLNVDMGSDSIL